MALCYTKILYQANQGKAMYLTNLSLHIWMIFQVDVAFFYQSRPLAN